MADDKNNRDGENSVFRVVNSPKKSEERSTSAPPRSSGDFEAWSDGYVDLAPPPELNIDFDEFVGHSTEGTSREPFRAERQGESRAHPARQEKPEGRANTEADVVRRSRSTRSDSEKRATTPSRSCQTAGSRSGGQRKARLEKGKRVNQPGARKADSPKIKKPFDQEKKEREFVEGETIRSSSSKPLSSRKNRAQRREKAALQSRMLSTPREAIRYDPEETKKKEKVFAARKKKKRKKLEEKIERDIDIENKSLQGGGKSDDKKKFDVQSNKRLESEKRRKIAIGAIVAVGIFAIVITLFLVIGVVKDCRIENAKAATYPVDTIQLEAGIVENKSRTAIVFLRKGRIISNITRNLPYIDSVDLKFDSAYSVTLTITETTDRFCLVDGEKQVWIDENGKVLSLTKKKLSANQAKVYGFTLEDQDVEIGRAFSPNDKNKDYFAILKKISKGISESGLNISRIDFYSENNICMTMNKVIKIYAKGETDFVKKFAGVKQYLKELGEITTDFYFDIRQKENIIYRFGTIN